MLTVLGWAVFGVAAVTAMALVGAAGAVVLIWAADKAEAFVAWAQERQGI
jgi:TRAP-type mannitol/chloroaromatic compound transport system permease large subunit